MTAGRWAADGAILATSNGGATWKAQSSGTGASLEGVTFANASDGWAVGYTGTIVATSNGGATWAPQYSGEDQYFLTGVAFANASDGWAVGDDGAILATISGGYSAPELTGFTPPAGPVGTSVTLSGAGFTGVTKVRFNGVAASFERVSDALIIAAVPSGATSGTITVITPGGTVTSSARFTVVRVTPKLTFMLSGLSSGTLKLGKRLTAKGTVTPISLAGSKVTLTVQRKQGGKWRKVKSLAWTIGTRGAYSGDLQARQEGQVPYACNDGQDGHEHGRHDQMVHVQGEVSAEAPARDTLRSLLRRPTCTPGRVTLRP